MALVVWCPLLGDNSQQGLSSVTLTSPGSTMSIVNTGKLGKTYDNSSKTAGGFRTSDVVDLGSAQSMFCWFKFVSLSDNSALGCGLISQHRFPKNTGLGITVKYVSATTGYLSANTGTGTSRTYNTYCGSTLLQANTWYHVGITYDGTNVLKLYVNGVCDGTHSVGQMSTPADYIMLYCWSLGSSSGATVHPNYILNGAMNDARVYDECLSPKEVEILSRGLVLHYPMTGGGRSGENLLRYTAVNSANQTLLKNTYAGSWSSVMQLTNMDGYDCYKYPTSSSSTAMSSGAWYTGMAANTTYTYSAWVYFTASSSTTFNFTSLGHFQVYNNQSTASDKSHEDVVSARIYEPSTISSNKWTKIRITFTTNNLEGSYFVIYPRYNIGANVGDLYIRGFKLELGSAPTPWLPHTADNEYASMGYSDTSEFDVSGYNNHGTKNGTITYLSDTARYSVSSYFNADTNYISRNATLGDIRTVSFWIKFPVAVSSTYRVAFADYTSRLAFGMINATTACCTCAGNTIKTFTISQFIVDKWYHIVVQYNSDKSDVQLYINGVAQTTRGNGDSWNHTTSTLMLGRRSTGSTINAYISDFRIYATTLSAIQVAELYNTSASISNNGTLMGYEFIEQ